MDRQEPLTTSYGSRVKPSGGIELTAWLFMRISGIVLLVLALGHLFIMHVFNSVHVIDYDFVARRYVKIFWRGYDLTMLWLAMIHGLNGMRTLVDDYLHPPARGIVVKGMYVVGGLFLILGTWVIMAFRSP
ncbi:MAG: succinate dehydrogenase hydrophobic membrane anchor subunit [Candidatus Omnitrophica bacterium]|nr:succinate dehydrogenase hydrophobic membrane anchor subunit [Candidatus Omnitrophota bacterium]